MRPDPHTALYAVVGNPVRHSLSPAIHNAAFSQTGINAVYLAFEPADIGPFIHAARTLGIRGISVTTPFKTRVIPFLSDMDPLAARIGAVNTVVNRNGNLTGHNTDGLGSVKALEEVTELEGKRVILVGAGGAARAVGWSLKDKGAFLVVVNRSRERGEGLAGLLECPYVPLKEMPDIRGDILIQTTPVGMWPHQDPSIIPAECLRAGMVVMDLIYRPAETRLLRMAGEKGCRTVSGIRMLIHQGREQFRLWTGIDPGIKVMEKAVQEAIEAHDDDP